MKAKFKEQPAVDVGLVCVVVLSVVVIVCHLALAHLDHFSRIHLGGHLLLTIVDLGGSSIPSGGLDSEELVKVLKSKALGLKLTKAEIIEASTHLTLASPACTLCPSQPKHNHSWGHLLFVCCCGWNWTHV